MKIKTHDQDYELEVYCLYWSNNIRHYLATVDLEREGLDVYTENNSTLLESSIDNFVLRKNSGGGDLLLHKAASEGDLLDDLIEHDQDATNIFLERLKDYQ